LDFIGIAIWTIGFIIENVADYEKSVFRANPENKGKWITKGLWKYSRHPNYFGEWVLVKQIICYFYFEINRFFFFQHQKKWSGMTLLSASAFSQWYHWIGLICPFWVLVF